MKRHEILQPFSRDHNVGLVIARRLSSGDKSAVQDFLRIWDDEMLDHFAEEEALLGPLAPPSMLRKLLADHRQIRILAERARASAIADYQVLELGKRLDAHIRWEEHVLFPAVEQSEDLESIRSATEELENRRHDSVHSPRRGELMDRLREK